MVFVNCATWGPQQENSISGAVSAIGGLMCQESARLFNKMVAAGEAVIARGDEVENDPAYLAALTEVVTHLSECQVCKFNLMDLEEGGKESEYLHCHTGI